MQELINKLDAEAEKFGNTGHRILDHVLERLKGADPELIAKIKKDKLSLGGAIERMRKEARKNESGGVGMLSDEDGFKIVDEYFGFSAAAEKKPVSLFDLI